ncbi:MAG: PKD domain-containing protein [Myxococcota bacterium]
MPLASPRRLFLGFGLVLLGTSFASDAHAWRHQQLIWAPESRSIDLRVADDGAENSIEACEASGGLSGCCEETVPAGACYSELRLGAEAWDAATCANIQLNVLDSIANPELAAPNVATFNLTDFENHITFNDPDDVLGPGVLAAQIFVFDVGRTIDVAGRPYQVVLSGDLSFNDNSVVFRTVDEIERNECSGGEYSMAAIAAHEFGHQLGLANSCENPALGGEPCDDPRLFEATMYWTAPACSLSQLTINEDDIEGLTALYGPSISFSCSNEASEGLAVGVVPLDLNCAIASADLADVTEAAWSWGDGNTATGTSNSHTYTEPGNYTIEVTVQGDSETCDSWSDVVRRVGYVRACGLPEPSFEVEQVDGLRYQLLNNSDVSVYGCISEIQWDVFEGEGTDGLRVFEPIGAWEPELMFPAPGIYTVALSLGGIAGSSGAVATFDVRRTGGTESGCNHQGFAMGGALPLLIGLLALRRRERLR